MILFLSAQYRNKIKYIPKLRSVKIVCLNSPRCLKAWNKCIGVRVQYMTLVALSRNAEILKKTTDNGNQHVLVYLESCYVQSQRKTGQDSLQVSQVDML